MQLDRHRGFCKDICNVCMLYIGVVDRGFWALRVLKIKVFLKVAYWLEN